MKLIDYSGHVGDITQFEAKIHGDLGKI